MLKQIHPLIGLIVCFSWTTIFAAENNSILKNISNAELLDWELIDYRSKSYQASDFLGQPLVVTFIGTECPIAKLYCNRLEQLQAEYAPQGVQFLCIDSNRQDSLTDLQTFATRQSLTYPILKDPAAKVAQRFSATRTPETFLLDAAGQLRYSGRIDDQYVIGNIRPNAETFDLKNALDAVLAGRSVTIKHRDAIGCLIGQQRNDTVATALTYTADIAPLMQKNCVDCHHAGDIGPMQLDNYDDVVAWSEMIFEVTDQKRMPPWHANPDIGHFANDRSMSTAELQKLHEWIRGGCPAGDLDSLPPNKTYVDGWQLPRAPDVVFDMHTQPVDVPATGEVKYRHYVVDPKFTEDKWITAAEIRPGNRNVVHHILVFARTPDKLRDFSAERSYLSGYVPGTRFKPFPPGMAKRIAAGSQLVFQVHYTPVGVATQDLSQIGFLFVDPADVTHEIHTTSVVQPRLSIPPHEANYQAEAYQPETLPDSELLSLSPHMHLRGKSFSFKLYDPQGKATDVLDVPNYDFNWQTAYQLAQRMPVAAGSRMYAHAVFDNSDRNPFNPDANQRVHWGDQTDDEMMIGYFDIAVSRQTQKAMQAANEQILSSNVLKGLQAVYQRWDRDNSSGLSRDELPKKYLTKFKEYDDDQDGVLNEREFLAAALIEMR